MLLAKLSVFWIFFTAYGMEQANYFRVESLPSCEEVRMYVETIYIGEPKYFKLSECIRVGG